jgi:Integrase core domain
VLGVEASGLRHWYIRPRRPQQNGKVEQGHRIDQEEFWGRHRFPDLAAAAGALHAWETRHNYDHNGRHSRELRLGTCRALVVAAIIASDCAPSFSSTDIGSTSHGSLDSALGAGRIPILTKNLSAPAQGRFRPAVYPYRSAEEAR